MVVQRGLRQAASYHQDRLRQERIGYFFDVITNGFGAMQGYAEQVPVRDRWLIARTSARCSSARTRRSTTCRPIAAARAATGRGAGKRHRD